MQNARATRGRGGVRTPLLPVIKSGNLTPPRRPANGLAFIAGAYRLPEKRPTIELIIPASGSFRATAGPKVTTSDTKPATTT